MQEKKINERKKQISTQSNNILENMNGLRFISLKLDSEHSVDIPYTAVKGFSIGGIERFCDMVKNFKKQDREEFAKSLENSRDCICSSLHLVLDKAEVGRSIVKALKRFKSLIGVELIDKDFLKELIVLPLECHDDTVDVYNKVKISWKMIEVHLSMKQK